MESMLLLSLSNRRLLTEKLSWIRNPLPGFIMELEQNEDGSLNINKWNCQIPGKKDTIWEGGMYPLEMRFDESYPVYPPICRFIPSLFHPNIDKNGYFTLTILERWRPSVTIKQILLAIQKLLHEPNVYIFPLNTEQYTLYTNNRAEYERRVREQVAQMKKTEQ